jgi:hypothetical protein
VCDFETGFLKNKSKTSFKPSKTGFEGLAFLFHKGKDKQQNIKSQ